MSESKLRGLPHCKNITGQAHQTTDCTDNTDKESEIFVDNKQRRHGDTDTTKHAFSSQFFKIASNSSKYNSTAKECEFRFNHCNENVYAILLKMIRQYPLF